MISNSQRSRWLLTVLLAFGLILRLGYGLAQNHMIVYQQSQGGDSYWYILNGYALITGFDKGLLTIPGNPSVQVRVALSGLPVAPVYLLFVGFWQVVASPEAAIMIIRILQAGMGTAVCFFAYRLARIISKNETAGLIAAGVLAVSPAFIMESAQVMTETVYMFLVMGGLWLYVERLHLPNLALRRSMLMLALSAALLGLATLTRAVLLVFPVGLAIHLLLVDGLRNGLKRAAILLLVYSLVVSTWTIYNLARWNRFVVGADGFISFLYIGATGWKDPNEVDKSLPVVIPEHIKPDGTFKITQDDYAKGLTQVIGSNPGGWIQRRVSQLIKVYAQPHGTVFFPGPSLKQMAGDWVKRDRSVSGLIALTQTEAFWPKLILYLFHYIGLIMGLAGLWISRHNWRFTLPLAGFLLYTTLVHLVLDAIPRYLFPMQAFWWIFAAVVFAALFRRFFAGETTAVSQSQIVPASR
jgi:4-amino-4-deoxy-L-arabinose transferase-like glycosyltransferase